MKQIKSLAVHSYLLGHVPTSYSIQSLITELKVTLNPLTAL